MTLALSTYNRTVMAAQYDGTNSSDIITFINTTAGGTVASLSGTTIVNPLRNMDIGMWISTSLDAPIKIYSDAEFQNNCAKPESNDAAMHGGQAPVSLAGGATNNITVDLTEPFSDDNFTATASISGAVSLFGVLVAGTPSVIDAGSVLVPVTNKALLTVNAGIVVVNAFHN